MAAELNGMRILMFTRTMAMGGTEKVVLQLCRALKGKAGFLGVMSHGGELESELDAMGVPRFEVPDITSKNLATFAEVSRELRRVVRENDVNIVHCHHRMAALYCRLVLPKGIRAVATAHNVFSGEHAATRFLYRDMRLAACGGRVYENLVSYYGLSKNLVTLIPNSVPEFNGEVTPIPEVAACPENTLKVGFVGRLCEQKGVMYLADAMAILAERGVRARCFIVGDGELEGDLRKRVRDSTAAGDVVFLGQRMDSQNFLSQVDVCAMPSLWEGLPLVLLEAFSVGTPVIASACDGILDVIADGENGILVKPGNAESLAKGLERICEDEGLHKRLGLKARADYESDYSYEAWSERYFDFYRETLR